MYVRLGYSRLEIAHVSVMWELILCQLPCLVNFEANAPPYYSMLVKLMQGKVTNLGSGVSLIEVRRSPFTLDLLTVSFLGDFLIVPYLVTSKKMRTEQTFMIQAWCVLSRFLTL